MPHNIRRQLSRLLLGSRLAAFGQMVLFFFFSAVIIYGFFFNKIFLRSVYVKSTYYILFVLVIAWTLNLVSQYKKHILPNKRHLKNVMIALIIAIGFSSFLYLSVPPDLRVLNDEALLLTASHNLTFQKSPETFWETVQVNGVIEPRYSGVGRRLSLFPFLVNLLHSVTGYRVANSFVFNFLMLAFFLTVLLFFTKKSKNWYWASALAFLVAAQPIFSLVSSSGSYDLLNTLFFAASMISLYYYLKSPSSALLKMLWLNLIMLANVRYESIVYLPITAALLIVTRRIRWQYVKDSVVYASTPLLLMPRLLHQFYISADFFSNEKTVWFNPDFMITNMRFFLQGLVDFRLEAPYATLINLTGIMALLLFLVLRARPVLSERSRSHTLFYFILTANLSVWFVTVILLKDSHIYYYAAASNYLCFFVGLSMMAFFLMSRIPYLNRRPVFPLIIALCLFIYYHPVAVENKFMNVEYRNRCVNHVLKFINREIDTDDLIIISKRPCRYAIYGYASIDIRHANRKRKSVLRDYRDRKYRNFLVVQDINKPGGKPINKTNLHKSFELKTLYELKNHPNRLMRISEIVNPRKQ